MERCSNLDKQLTRYEVTFGVQRSQNKWTATYRAESFGEAEEKALGTLAQNDDRDSYILRIELW